MDHRRAPRASLARFERSVAGIVPHDRWRDPAGAGGSSIAWLVLHTAYHEDVAVNAVVGAGEPLMTHWRGRLGLDRLAPHIGLGEAEDAVAHRRRSTSMPSSAYLREVHLHTAAWLDELDPAMLDAVAVERRGPRARRGSPTPTFPWLHSMWADQPVAFYVRVGGDRPPHAARRRNGLGPQPARPQPVLTHRRSPPLTVRRSPPRRWLPSGPANVPCDRLPLSPLIDRSHPCSRCVTPPRAVAEPRSPPPHSPSPHPASLLVDLDGDALDVLGVPSVTARGSSTGSSSSAEADALDDLVVEAGDRCDVLPAASAAI